MSRQKLESIFTAPPGPKPFARSDLRLKGLPQLQDFKMHLITTNQKLLQAFLIIALSSTKVKVSYFCDMISNFNKSHKQKSQLTMKPKIMSSAHGNQKRTPHTRSDNAKTVILKDTDKIIR